jgi:hypothetical protein
LTLFRQIGRQLPLIVAFTFVIEPLEPSDGGLSQFFGRDQLFDVFRQRLHQDQLGMSCRAATTPTGEQEGCWSVSRGQPPGHPFNLQPHSVQLVKLFIPPRNQRSGVQEARGATMCMGGTIRYLWRCALLMKSLVTAKVCSFSSKRHGAVRSLSFGSPAACPWTTWPWICPWPWRHGAKIS